MPLDETDRNILAHLAADARLSHREIARRISMSPGAVSDRIDRLERRGVVRGYHADIDPVALGFPTEALIGIQVTQGHSVDETMASLYLVPEVRSVALVTGRWDFVVEVQVQDQDHLREVLVESIWKLEVFRHSETLMVLKRLEHHASWFAVDGV